MKNIFIEGIQGNGKTTLLRLLGQQLENYHVYWEGDYNPVELAWCTYMTEAEYEQALNDFPDLMDEIKKHTRKEGEQYIVEYTRILAERRAFYEYMERFELYNGRKSLGEFKDILLKRYYNFSGEGNIFECSFFQNTMEELLLYHEMPEKDIVDFYKDLFESLKEKNFLMIYLSSDKIEENILQIKKERSDGNGNEMWYPLMLRYLNETPYGKAHPFSGVSDMVAHFERRMKVEQKVIEEVLGNRVIVLPAKEFDLDELVKMIGEK